MTPHEKAPIDRIVEAADAAVVAYVDTWRLAAQGFALALERLGEIVADSREASQGDYTLAGPGEGGGD